MGKISKIESSIHERLVVEILRTGGWLENQVSETVKCYDITHIQYNILRILNGAYPNSLNPSDIKSRLIFEKSDLTRLIDRLVSKGLVVRQTCPSNRRKVDIFLTHEGRNVIDAITPRIREALNGFFTSRLSENEAASVIEQLMKIRESLKEKKQLEI